MSEEVTWNIIHNLRTHIHILAVLGGSEKWGKTGAAGRGTLGSFGCAGSEMSGGLGGGGGGWKGAAISG